MCNCTSRPLGAEALAKHSWNDVQRDDSWWHCRRLLQLLTLKYLEDKDYYQHWEQRLMLVLAAVECGSTEAVLWLMPLEGLLAEISQRVMQFPWDSQSAKGSDLQLQADLVRELTIFAHATAVCSINLRSYRAPVRLHGIQKWYTQIYLTNPQCSYPGCLQLLPCPRILTSPGIMGRFVVGNKDARTRSPSTRCFISDRPQAYDCLVDWIRRQDADPTIFNTFMWFARLFHACKACTSKAGRGKWRENF